MSGYFFLGNEWILLTQGNAVSGCNFWLLCHITYAVFHARRLTRLITLVEIFGCALPESWHLWDSSESSDTHWQGRRGPSSSSKISSYPDFVKRFFQLVCTYTGRNVPPIGWRSLPRARGLLFACLRSWQRRLQVPPPPHAQFFSFVRHPSVVDGLHPHSPQ